MVYTFKPSSWEAEAGSSLWVQSQPGLQSSSRIIRATQRNSVSFKKKKKQGREGGKEKKEEKKEKVKTKKTAQHYLHLKNQPWFESNAIKAL